jgi:hypothetical protein
VAIAAFPGVGMMPNARRTPACGAAADLCRASGNTSTNSTTRRSARLAAARPKLGITRGNAQRSKPAARDDLDAGETDVLQRSRGRVEVQRHARRLPRSPPSRARGEIAREDRFEPRIGGTATVAAPARGRAEYGIALPLARARSIRSRRGGSANARAPGASSAQGSRGRSP